MKTIKKHAFKAYMVMTSLVIIFILLSFKNLQQSFEEINAKRLNIIDENGRSRIVISNQQHFPLPILDGKEFPRRINPAGMIFYDEKGNEYGGFVLTTDGTQRLKAFMYDYDKSEAMGYYSEYDTVNAFRFKSGIVINDRPLPGNYRFKGDQPSRIELMTTDGNASLTIKDRRGKPRIIITVDSLDRPSIVMLDKESKIVKRITDL